MKQTVFQLKNKMNVILIPSHKSPVVSVQMWVRTGSADEKKKEEGISHFIEHLVFKGTRKYKVGEIANTIEASGGELNAYTSFDQTVFYVTISKNYMSTAMDVIAEMMGFPAFDEDEVKSEREVVCEEIKMGMDSPGRSSSQLLFKSVFKKHPYGVPVIGYDKNVRSWSVKKIKNYYESRYVPSNMTLVISGDFDEKETKKQVIQIFSEFKPNKLKKIKRASEPIQKKPTFSCETKDIVESTYQMAWPIPHIKHKDIPALDVLAMILGQGETSRLYQRLRLNKPLVNNISAFSYSPLDPGLFAISAKTTDQDPLLVSQELFQVLEEVIQQGVTWEDLRKAIINISSEQFYSIETVDGIANKIGSEFFYMKDGQAYKKYLKKIQALKPQDIQKVAKKYLDINKTNYSVLNKSKKNEQISTLKKIHAVWNNTKKNKISQKIKNKKISIPKIKFNEIKAEASNEIEIYKTKLGTEILFKKVSDIPTVSSKIIFGGGSRLETEEKQGTTELLTRIWPAVTKNKTEDEILNIIEDSAAGLNSFGGKNTIGLSLDYMKTFEKRMLSLAEEVLLEPRFDESIFIREKNVLEKQILSKQDNPSYLCARQFLKTMFPDSIMSYDQSGTAETLKNINIENIEQQYQAIQSLGNMQVCVVGDFDKKAWIELVEKVEKTFKLSGKKLEKTKIKKLNENKKAHLTKDKEQSHVMIGWQALTLNDPRRHTLEIIQAVLAGQGGRLFIELRDKNSLAYSVSPIKMETLETGYFGGYIACSPDKVDKAVEMFQKEFNKLTNELISSEELERAQKYLIGQHDIGLQRKSSYCNLISFDYFYGNNLDESLDVAKVYNQITREDVRELAKQLFTQNYVISTVGR